MALLSNSSISNWLHFDGIHLDVPTCEFYNFTGDLAYYDNGGTAVIHRPTITKTSCTQVCNDSASLFTSQSNNLVACGLWTSLLSAYTFLDSENVLQINQDSDSRELLGQFHDVGLDLEALGYASSYADTISSCLQLLYYNAKFFTYSDDGTTAAACTRDVLFPLGSNTNSSRPVTTALVNCLSAICSPITLNPDLAGIGVFSSFMIQSTICIIALAALLTLERLVISGRATKNVHAPLIAALVDFHKIQCFFSSTIQITALILFQESQRSTALDKYAVRGKFQDFFDTCILIVLATSGFIPTVFTLVCINRYGRQSWYLLLLSLITILLATTTLVCSYVYAHDFGIPKQVYTSNMQNAYFYSDDYYNSVSVGSTVCDIKGRVGESVMPLCGSTYLAHNYIGSGTVANYWIWVVWANCMICFFSCAGRHYCHTKGNSLNLYRRCLGATYARFPLLRLFFRVLTNHGFWAILSVLIWSACFASQFYLFSVYFQHYVISKQWSFGQIIAVTVWVPSIVEFIYIEYNGFEIVPAYRSAAPLGGVTSRDQSIHFAPFRGQSHSSPPTSISERSNTSEIHDITDRDEPMRVYRELGL